jgi:hypothetical protein
MAPDDNSLPVYEEAHDIEQDENDIIADRAYEVCNLCKDAFTNELSRHEALTAKANIYISLIGLLLAALFIKMNDFILLINTFPSYLFVAEILLYLMCIVCFAVSVWKIISAITILNYTTYPQDIFESFKKDSRSIIFSSIAKYLSDASKENYTNNNKKAQRLAVALSFVRVGLVFLLITFLSIIIIKTIGGK